MVGDGCVVDDTNGPSIGTLAIGVRTVDRVDDTLGGSVARIGGRAWLASAVVSSASVVEPSGGGVVGDVVDVVEDLVDWVELGNAEPVVAAALTPTSGVVETGSPAFAVEQAVTDQSEMTMSRRAHGGRCLRRSLMVATRRQRYALDRSPRRQEIATIVTIRFIFRKPDLGALSEG